MLTLGIETSCDETSAAVIRDGNCILSNVISSQIETHQPYGGVVPEIASRKHLENILSVIEAAIEQAKVSPQMLDLIAVTQGPGLVGALLVGVSAAKALAYALQKPLVGVNHIEGHIYANFLEHRLQLPLLSLVVSGGHTSLIYMHDHNKRQLLGATRDDAAGEVFDKVARKLGLDYPGGPAIERLALQGNPSINFPRAWLDKGSYDFSFSGLKTAVINYTHTAAQRGEQIAPADIAASFQEAIFEVLITKTIKAAKETNNGTIALAGGVAANQFFRAGMAAAANDAGIQLLYPSLKLCTDNAAMIACAGYYQFKRGKVSGLDLNAVPNLPMELEK